MHIAMTGSHGLIGSALRSLLTAGDHRVAPLVRGTAGAGEITWDPSGDAFDASALNGLDGVVHLAAANIAAARWTAAQKERIRQTRVDGTRLLCEALARLASPPKVLVSASAIGFYGDRGDELLDENSAPGQGFLADVARQWEAATEAASAVGIRVVLMRYGVVLSPKSGALASMLRPFRFGVGGTLGGGRQFFSWIALDDAVRATMHALTTDSLHGPVNAVSPNPVTNAAFTKVLGRVLHRPTIMAMPAVVLRLALGEMADQLLLSSTRVEPNRLQNTGYQFRYTSVEDALRQMLGKPAVCPQRNISDSVAR